MKSLTDIVLRNLGRNALLIVYLNLLRNFHTNFLRNIGYNVKVTVYCMPYDRECRRSQIHTDRKYKSINERNVTLVCDGSSLKYNSKFFVEDAMSCDDIKWSINVELNQDEESQKSWCKEDYQTFDLSTNNLDQNRILAKICFDFSLRSIKYKTIERKTKMWNEKNVSENPISNLTQKKKTTKNIWNGYKNLN